MVPKEQDTQRSSLIELKSHLCVYTHTQACLSVLRADEGGGGSYQKKNVIFINIYCLTHCKGKLLRVKTAYGKGIPHVIWWVKEGVLEELILKLWPERCLEVWLFKCGVQAPSRQIHKNLEARRHQWIRETWSESVGQKWGPSHVVSVDVCKPFNEFGLYPKGNGQLSMGFEKSGITILHFKNITLDKVKFLNTT